MHNPSLTTSIYDDFPADVPLGAVQSILSHFGIYNATDDDGTCRWTINIQRDTATSLQQEAYFEARTRSWKLRDTFVPTQALEHSSDDSTSTSHSPSKSLPASSARPDGVRLPDVKDWLDSLPQGHHTDFFRGVAWDKTPLGSLDTWSLSLRLYTHMILSQKIPTALYWGDDHIAIYNEGLIPLIGQTHPYFMGGAFFDVWPELLESFSAIFDQLTTTGTGIELVDYNLFLQRNNYNEETWWRGNLFPLADDSGKIGGCCFLWHEVTRQVLLDRRTQMLNEMSQFSMSPELDTWEHIRKTLRRSPRDIAMAILYSIDDSDSGTHRILRRQGVVGIDTDHVAAPELLNVDTSKAGFAPAMRTALDSGRDWICLEKSSENFPVEVLEGIDWQGYQEPSSDLILIPVKVTNNDLRGFVILGLNPRRAFDADHRQFVTDMHRQLISIMTSVTTAQHAIAREAKLMSELAESERRIRQLAELAPMGLFDLSADGRMRWANNHYFRILGIERPENIADTAWIDPVDPEDLARVESIFRKCIEDDAEFAGTVRLKRTWQPPVPTHADHEPVETSHVHIYFQALSYREGETTTSIMGSVTDVSRFVWAESVQAVAAHNAQQARHRQEEFVDMVSHELRNPLSAIMQCAETVLGSLRELGDANAYSDACRKAIESCNDAAETILLCASHQKRIVDDILTLSKLDADLVKLKPAVFQPSTTQNDVTQMFRAEFDANQIQVTSELDETCSVGHSLTGDATRISQILVNLTTNAIKYQKLDGEHKIKIVSGICSQPPPPSKFGTNFQWATSKKKYREIAAYPEYGTGRLLYLYFSVQDTGQGLPNGMAVQIFDKFVQTNRRSHVKYGSSGLGLYISRHLCEMQGGMIGVASEAGVGSTFAFYVQVRQTLEEESPARKVLSLRPQPHSPDMKFTLLLVEDNLVNQKILAKQLVKAGHTVYVSNHGGEAVDFLLTMLGHEKQYSSVPTSDSNAQPKAKSVEVSNIDCILMDWEMPVLDGLAATRKIRELEIAGTVTTRHNIVGITANARAEQIDRAISAGMDAVVTKPFRLADLISQIHAVLEKSQSTTAVSESESAAVSASEST